MEEQIPNWFNIIAGFASITSLILSIIFFLIALKISRQTDRTILQLNEITKTLDTKMLPIIFKLLDKDSKPNDDPRLLEEGSDLSKDFESGRDLGSIDKFQ